MMDTHEQPSENDPQLKDFFEKLEGKVDSTTKTYQAELTGFFAGLGPTIDIAKRAQAKLDRIAATRFSVFRYFHTGELDLSRIFADLLNPSGRHGQGDCFLQLFLDMLPSRMSILCSGPNLHQCEVRTEFPTRGHGEQAPRKIDVVLKMPNELWIGIENKPWADDRDGQIEAYWKDLNERGTARMLYFSGEGTDPSKSSLGNLRSTPHRWLTVPFRSDTDGKPSLESWIQRCREQCEAEVVRWFLKDLLEYIRRQFKLPTPAISDAGEN